MEIGLEFELWAQNMIYVGSANHIRIFGRWKQMGKNFRRKIASRNVREWLSNGAEACQWKGLEERMPVGMACLSYSSANQWYAKKTPKVEGKNCLLFD